MDPLHAVIELDAFSGRPNPRWTLPRSAVDDVVRSLECLPPGEEPPHAKSLGPRGVRILLDDHLAREIHVCGSTVTVVDSSGARRILRDEPRQLSHGLIALLRATLRADELEAYDPILQYLSACE